MNPAEAIKGFLRHGALSSGLLLDLGGKGVRAETLNAIFIHHGDRLPPAP